MEESGHPCRFFSNKENNEFWFRVLYNKNLIHLEASHAMSDGTGAIYFLQAIGYRYIQLMYENKLSYEQRNKRYGLQNGMNVTDGYALNYRKVKRNEHRQPQAYKISGKRNSIADMRIITANMSATELKAVSNTWHATVSEYMSAVLLMIVRDSYPDIGRKTIRIELPVNLRPLFNTETSLNFFSNIGIALKPEEFSYSFEEILLCVKKQFKDKIRKEQFESRFGFTVWGERCILAKITPDIAKNWFLRRMYELCGGNSTIGFSNIGKITIEQGFAPFIKGISAIATPTPYVPIEIVSCSVKDIFAMNIALNISDDMICRKKIHNLKEKGITIY